MSEYVFICFVKFVQKKMLFSKINQWLTNDPRLNWIEQKSRKMVLRSQQFPRKVRGLLQATEWGDRNSVTMFAWREGGYLKLELNLDHSRTCHFIVFCLLMDWKWWQTLGICVFGLCWLPRCPPHITGLCWIVTVISYYHEMVTWCWFCRQNVHRIKKFLKNL